jgi:L-iditol 2-dehydrogenase
MKAAVLKNVRNLAIEEIPEPQAVPPGYVRVAVKAVGICGSDVHYYREGAIGSFVLRDPMILGHEVGGVVDAVGEGVTIPVGTVVALEPGIPCMSCEHCRTGRYNLCPDVKFFATPPIDGAMTSFVNHPEEFTFPAEGLTPEEASLAEPMSVGISAVRQARIHLGLRAAILGAGPVGVLTAFAANAEGANVVLFDVQEERVAIAKQLGFSAYLFGEGPSEEYDVVIDCSGNKQAIEWGQSVVKRGGKLILVGMGSEESMRINGLDLCLREVSVQGIFRYANTFPAAIELIRRNKDKLSLFTQTKIDLEDLPTYLEQEKYLQSLKTIISL